MDPWREPERKSWRRHLPHLEAPGATYFVTVSCRRPITLSAEARDIVMAEIASCDSEAFYLDAAVVMTDHAHAVFRLIVPFTLGQISKRIKRRTAHRINRIEGREGQLWTQESFDHVIRDEREFAEKIDYIRKNPVKRELVVSSEQYSWLYIRERKEAEYSASTTE